MDDGDDDDDDDDDVSGAGAVAVAGAGVGAGAGAATADNLFFSHSYFARADHDSFIPRKKVVALAASATGSN